MAQALLNSLNIIKESNCSFKEKSYTDAGNDFAKIFDLANSKAAENSKLQKNDTNNDTKKLNVNEDVKKSVTENTKDTNTDKKEDLKNIKTESKDTEKETKTDNSDAKKNISTDDKKDTKQETTLQNIILEAAIETVVAECLVGKIDSDNANDTSETEAEDAETQAVAETQETTDEEQDTITENTEKNEAPTMYKELNTLENPTAALILQTQIKTSTKQIQQNHETGNQSSVKEQENLLKDAELNSNQKSFENDMSRLSVMNTATKTDTTEKTDGLKMKTMLNENVVKELNVQNVQADGANTGAEGESFTQSPQEQVVKVMIQGDLKMESSFETIAKSTVLKPEAANPSKIIEQISKQLESMGNGSKLTMVLNPESLGKINIQLLTTKTGLTAQLTVTTAEARDLLMKGLEGLKENLLSQGISVDNVSIKLEESANEENPFDWTEQEGSKGGYKQQESRRQKDEEKQQFEQLMFEYNNGNV